MRERIGFFHCPRSFRICGDAPGCPGNAFDPAAAIVTLGFFLLLAQASRMLTFGAADTAPVPW
jgi:hypothetical protein